MKRHEEAERNAAIDEEKFARGASAVLGAGRYARAMSNLGIEFADRKLKSVLSSNVTNARAAVQLHWLKKSYPDTPIEELLKYTHSVRYAEAAITQAGFRIKSIRLQPKHAYGSSTAAQLASESTYYRADTDLLTFIKRHGIAPDEIIEHGQTFEILVESFTSAK